MNGESKPGDRLAIGRLGAPHGVRGDIKVHSYSGEFEHFLGLKEADLEPDTDSAPATQPRRLHLQVLRVEGGPGGLLMAFKGYESPEAARALTGLNIVVERSRAAPLKPNEWYVTDLVGLELVSGGTSLARVRAVVEGGPDPWLEAELPDGSRALVPFRKEFVGEVDLPGRRIELLAPWLLEP